MADTSLSFSIFARDFASKVFTSVGQQAQKTEAAFSKFGSVAGKALKGIGLAAGGAAVAGGFLGIKTAASMEQAKIAFETMLGSAKKADVFLKQLSDFAAKTPFEFPELQTAASSLISAGINANKVIPIMKTLGNVTSGMGTGSEGVKRATVALQQMNAAGRITGEDLNQLRDAGIPVYDLLAKATGKSKAQVVALAQAGKLGSKELGQMMRALETGAGLERFSGLMEKQSHSLTGLWSTFKDTLGMGLARLITPALPALKAGLDMMSRLLSSAFNGIGRVLEPAIDVVRLFFGTISGKGADVSSEFANKHVNAIIDAGARAGQMFGRLSDVFTGTVVPALRQVGGFLRDNVLPILVGVGTFIVEKVVPPALQLARVFYENLAGAFRSVGATIDAHRPQLEQLLNAIKRIAEFALAIVVPVLKVAIPIAFEILGTAIKVAITIIASLVHTFGAIKDAAASVFGWISDHWRLLAAVLLGPIGAAVVVIVDNFGKIKSVAEFIFRAVRLSIGVTIGAFRALAGVIGSIGGGIGDIFFGVVRAIVSGMNKVIDVINAAIRAYNAIPFVSNIGTIGHISAPSAPVAPSVTYGGIYGVGFAQGGIVKATAGGVPATIGEGRYDEAVIPLPSGWRNGGAGLGGGSVTLQVYAPIGSQQELEDWLAGALDNLRRKGRAA